VWAATPGAMKWKILFTLLFLPALAFCGGLSLPPATGPETEEDPVGRLEEVAAGAFNQKLYLHLDNHHYHAGDYIWFKAYLLDGVTHRYVPGETNVYVEMIDSRGRLVKKQILKSVNGISWGDFRLSDSIPDGNYLVRAYTNPMRNMGEAFLFNRNIYVSNPGFRDYIRLREIIGNRLFNRSLERKASQYEFAFHAEGGTLVQGLPSRLAFRATDLLGGGVPAEGRILDRHGNVVAEFTTGPSGRGVTAFSPEEAGGYTARVRLAGQRREERIPLPEVLPRGAVLQVRPGDKALEVKVLTNSPPMMEPHAPVRLMVHTRGEVYFWGDADLRSGQFFKVFPYEELPAGIAEVSLLGPGNTVLASRLVFVPDTDPFSISLHEVAIEEGMGRVIFSVEDSHSFPFYGNYSLSVRGLGESSGRKEAGGSLPRSFLLVESDTGRPLDSLALLPGTVSGEDMAWIDQVMLTSRFERLDLEGVLSGRIPVGRFEPSFGMTVAGRLIHPGNDKPVPGQNISLSISNGFVTTHTTQTDTEGWFEFADLGFDGMVTIELITSPLREGYHPRVHLDLGSIQDPSYRMDFSTRPQEVTRKGPFWTRVRRQREKPYDIPEYYSPLQNYYGQPSQTIHVSERTEDNKTVLDILLQRATGISFHNGQLTIRGASSINLSSEPQFIMDGSFTDMRNFLSTNAREVHRIEIFSGPNAAIFGIRGTNGVIVGYTRRGGMFGRQSYEFNMAGFYRPREFTADKAGDLRRTAEDDTYHPTLYWYPNLRVRSGERVRFDFQAPQGHDAFEMVLEGVGPAGRIISGTFLITRGETSGQ